MLSHHILPFYQCGAYALMYFPYHIFLAWYFQRFEERTPLIFVYHLLSIRNGIRKYFKINFTRMIIAFHWKIFMCKKIIHRNQLNLVRTPQSIPIPTKIIWKFENLFYRPSIMFASFLSFWGFVLKEGLPVAFQTQNSSNQSYLSIRLKGMKEL